MLSSIRHSNDRKTGTPRYDFFCVRGANHGIANLLQFFNKPSYLLLENKRSEAGSKGDDQTFLLALFLERLLLIFWRKTSSNA